LTGYNGPAGSLAGKEFKGVEPHELEERELLALIRRAGRPVEGRKVSVGRRVPRPGETSWSYTPRQVLFVTTTGWLRRATSPFEQVSFGSSSNDRTYDGAEAVGGDGYSPM
jgi:hypothetical protein